MTETILHIDASARFEGSATRDLTARIVAAHPDARVITRDLANTALPQVSEAWVNAKATPADDLTEAQKNELALSDGLIRELQAADTVVIGLPVYNFTLPASLKAWVDLVARPGLTFRYSEQGPEGLLKDKRAILAMASGGTKAGSEIDFATPYMRHILGFLGITDVTVIAADQLALDNGASLERAKASIGTLRAAA